MCSRLPAGRGESRVAFFRRYFSVISSHVVKLSLSWALDWQIRRWYAVAVMLKQVSSIDTCMSKGATSRSSGKRGGGGFFFKKIN